MELQLVVFVESRVVGVLGADGLEGGAGDVLVVGGALAERVDHVEGLVVRDTCVRDGILGLEGAHVLDVCHAVHFSTCMSPMHVRYCAQTV